MLEVADVFRRFGPQWRKANAGHISLGQQRAMTAIEICRTAALGGHVERCEDCAQMRIAYNSCRNRHCPRCQALARAHWLDRQEQHLLPVAYHHVVFTLPAELADLAHANPALLYDLLMRSAAATLREVAANPKHLGAVVGVLMVLHTWGQNLHHHPHVHCVVTGGGLSCDATGQIDALPRWVACRPGFFLPVRVLSCLFRGKLLAGLRRLAEAERLRLPGKLAPLADPHRLAAWLRPLYAKSWVVYSKPPFGGPRQVLKYLARYTHRVAISSSRLLELREGRVSFLYKDYADDHRARTMTLDAEEFLRRFVQHVLPRGFVKVRHYGLLAHRHRQERLALCRRLLLVANVAATLAEGQAVRVEPAQRRCCSRCGGTRLLYRGLLATEVTPLEGVEPADSS
ncbi:MAG: IS91 family transposase [Caldilineaceae bacterium]|nr:IS91 family transposase [Caldilineaceae bacterium]